MTADNHPMGIAEVLRQKVRGLREMLAFDNGLSLVADRLLHPAANVAIYRLGGLEIAVDRSGGDVASIRGCLASPMYSALLADVRRSSGTRVLDVGANVGGFPLMLVTQGFGLKSVVALEINPNTALRLRYNLAVNLHGHGTKVEVLEAGLWKETGFMDAAFGWGDTGDSLRPTSGPAARARTRVLSLDNVIQTYFPNETIDLCKIDIEGAEHEVFAQSGFERLAQATNVVIEIHERGNGHAAVRSAIESLGFLLVRKGEDAPDCVYLFRKHAA